MSDQPKLAVFGKWIMDEATARNVSLRTIAIEAGLAPSTLSRYTQPKLPGEHIISPPREVVIKLALYFKYSVDAVQAMVDADLVDVQALRERASSGDPAAAVLFDHFVLSPEALLIAEMFNALPEEFQAIIRSTIIQAFRGKQNKPREQ